MAGVKRLYLLRHAKSSWDDLGLEDDERPLAPRGEKAARRIGRHLRDIGVQPEQVLCSPAVRARQTLDHVRPFLEPKVEIQFDPAIYGAGEDQLLARLRQVPSTVRSLMLIGHNPGLQDLALTLVDEADLGYARLVERFPTAAIAALVLPIESWGDLAPGKARLDHFVLPRELS